MSSVRILPKYPAPLFDKLYRMLNAINIPIKSESQRNTRRGFGTHRSTTFGIVRRRYDGQLALSAPSVRWPAIYAELVALGASLDADFAFTSIHVNKNVVCPPHLDAKNVGESMIVSFGDYDGCELVVDGVVYDTKYHPHIFNGSLLQHHNNDTLIGTKYSLVYFNVCKTSSR